MAAAASGSGSSAALCDLVGPVQRAGQVADALHEPEPVGLVALDDLGGQQHRPGRPAARQRRQAGHGPLVDGQAQPTGRDAEAGLGGRHPQIARHRQLRPRPEGGAVGGRQRHVGSQAQPVEHRAQQRREPGVLDTAEVGAGAEVAGGAGEDDHAHVVPAPVQGRAERLERRVVEGVAALGSIDRDDDHVAAGFRVDHGRGRYRRAASRPKAPMWTAPHQVIRCGFGGCARGAGATNARTGS